MIFCGVCLIPQFSVSKSGQRRSPHNSNSTQVLEAQTLIMRGSTRRDSEDEAQRSEEMAMPISLAQVP
jgi:hypothetical protein